MLAAFVLSTAATGIPRPAAAHPSPGFLAAGSVLVAPSAGTPSAAGTAAAAAVPSETDFFDALQPGADGVYRINGADLEDAPHDDKRWKLDNFPAGTYEITERHGANVEVEIEEYSTNPSKKRIKSSKFCLTGERNWRPADRESDTGKWRRSNNVATLIYNAEAGDGNPTSVASIDDAGHLNGDLTGGGSHVFNLVAMDAGSNRWGEYKNWENALRRRVRQEPNTTFCVTNTPAYDGGTQSDRRPGRPTNFEIKIESPEGSLLEEASIDNPILSDDSLKITPSYGVKYTRGERAGQVKPLSDLLTPNAVEGVRSGDLKVLDGKGGEIVSSYAPRWTDRPVRAGLKRKRPDALEPENWIYTMQEAGATVPDNTDHGYRVRANGTIFYYIDANLEGMHPSSIRALNTQLSAEVVESRIPLKLQDRLYYIDDVKGTADIATNRDTDWKKRSRTYQSTIDYDDWAGEMKDVFEDLMGSRAFNDLSDKLFTGENAVKLELVDAVAPGMDPNRVAWIDIDSRTIKIRKNSGSEQIHEHLLFEMVNATKIDKYRAKKLRVTAGRIKNGDAYARAIAGIEHQVLVEYRTTHATIANQLSGPTRFGNQRTELVDTAMNREQFEAFLRQEGQPSNWSFYTNEYNKIRQNAAHPQLVLKPAETERSRALTSRQRGKLDAELSNAIDRSRSGTFRERAWALTEAMEMHAVLNGMAGGPPRSYSNELNALRGEINARVEAEHGASVGWLQRAASTSNEIDKQFIVSLAVEAQARSNDALSVGLALDAAQPDGTSDFETKRSAMEGHQRAVNKSSIDMAKARAQSVTEQIRRIDRLNEAEQDRLRGEAGRLYAQRQALSGGDLTTVFADDPDVIAALSELNGALEEFETVARGQGFSFLERGHPEFDQFEQKVSNKNGKPAARFMKGLMKHAGRFFVVYDVAATTSAVVEASEDGRLLVNTIFDLGVSILAGTLFTATLGSIAVLGPVGLLVGLLIAILGSWATHSLANWVFAGFADVIAHAIFGPVDRPPEQSPTVADVALAPVVAADLAAERRSVDTLPDILEGHAGELRNKLKRDRDETEADLAQALREVGVRPESSVQFAASELIDRFAGPGDPDVIEDHYLVDDLESEASPDRENLFAYLQAIEQSGSVEDRSPRQVSAQSVARSDGLRLWWVLKNAGPNAEIRLGSLAVGLADHPGPEESHVDLASRLMARFDTNGDGRLAYRSDEYNNFATFVQTLPNNGEVSISGTGELTYPGVTNAPYRLRGSHPKDLCRIVCWDDDDDNSDYPKPVSIRPDEHGEPPYRDLDGESNSLTSGTEEGLTADYLRARLVKMSFSPTQAGNLADYLIHHFAGSDRILTKKEIRSLESDLNRNQNKGDFVIQP